MQGTSHSGRAWTSTRGAHTFRWVVVSSAIALSIWSAVFSTGTGGRPVSALVVRAERPVLERGNQTAVLARAVVRRPGIPTPPSLATAIPTPKPVPAPSIIATAPAPPVASVVTAVRTTCSDALAYLASHAAPDFVASCGPGNSMGRYGYTCWNVAPQCGNGGRVIHIACPAPFVYQNEAHNSWALLGQRAGIDPYGQGSAAEQAFCDRYR